MLLALELCGPSYNLVLAITILIPLGMIAVARRSADRRMATGLGSALAIGTPPNENRVSVVGWCKGTGDRN